MKAVIQRVKSASVKIEGKVVGKIGSGILIFLGIEKGDQVKDMDYLINKIITLRIFNDDKGMNKSLQDTSGAALVISQFTLCANTHKGRRPSFINAEKPKIANYMYSLFCKMLTEKNIAIQMGKFGTHMAVESINDGPVTIILDTKIIKK